MSDNLLLTSLWLVPLIGLVTVLIVAQAGRAGRQVGALGFTSLTFLITLVVLGVYLGAGIQGQVAAERVGNNKLTTTDSTRELDHGRRVGRRERPGRPPRVDSVFQYSVLPGCGRDQPQPGRPDRAGRRAGVPGLVEHRQAGQGLLRALPAAVHQHDRRVHLARPVPVLRLLRGDAAADVLPDRHLGRAEARVRRDQVPALHALWLGLHPGGDPDPLLLAKQRECPGSRAIRSTSSS